MISRRIRPITEKEYYVEGCTALLDAIATAANFGISAARPPTITWTVQAGTQLNYQTVSDVVSDIRANRTIKANWKAKIDEDYERRRK